MMSSMQHFQDFSYVSANLRFHINFSELDSKLDEAQLWLGQRVLEDCKPNMPFRTGDFQNRSHVEDGGRTVIFPGPFGRWLYMGVRTDGNPIQYTSPTAVPMWFDITKEQNYDAWLRGVKERLGVI